MCLSHIPPQEKDHHGAVYRDNLCLFRSMNNSIFIDDFTAGVDRLHVHFDNVIVAGDLNYDFTIPRNVNHCNQFATFLISLIL